MTLWGDAFLALVVALVCYVIVPFLLLTTPEGRELVGVYLCCSAVPATGLMFGVDGVRRFISGRSK